MTLVSRSAAGLKAVADEIRGRGGRAEALVLDVNDTTRCGQALAAAGASDILINSLARDGADDGGVETRHGVRLV